MSEKVYCNLCKNVSIIDREAEYSWACGLCVKRNADFYLFCEDSGLCENKNKNLDCKDFELKYIYSRIEN